MYLMYIELTKKIIQQQYFLTQQGLFSFLFLVPVHTFYADYVEIP